MPVSAKEMTLAFVHGCALPVVLRLLHGCRYVVNRKVALYAAPVVAISLAVHAATGNHEQE
jgi:hypothetical protein